MFEKLNFKVFGDSRGNLISLESLRNIPFEIKRIYYIYGNKDNAARGFHAHYKLKQVLICVNGRCKIRLDDGTLSQSVELNTPNEGLLIDSCMWREMYDFSPDAVLLVLASELYDETDYIRDYNDFLQFVKKGE